MKLLGRSDREYELTNRQLYALLNYQQIHIIADGRTAERKISSIWQFLVRVYVDTWRHGGHSEIIYYIISMCSAWVKSSYITAR
jgi:hypothetical protein